MSSDRATLRDDLRALPFIAPFLLLFIVFIAYPLVYSFWISLHRVTLFSDFYDIFGTMQFVGLDNYARILADPVFLWSVLLTGLYAAMLIVPGMALSLALALALNHRRRGYGSLRAGFFLPNVFDIFVVGVIWLLLFNPEGGLATRFLHALGARQVAADGVLNTPWLTLAAIALTMVLKNAGFGMILFLTSLNNISASLFEAAEVDGATKTQTLVHVTLPMLKPIILFLSITGLVGALNAFAEIYALTDNSGGPSIRILGETLQSARISGYHLFSVFSESMYGEAAAISFVLLFLAIGIAFLNFKIIGMRD